MVGQAGPAMQEGVSRQQVEGRPMGRHIVQNWIFITQRRECVGQKKEEEERDRERPERDRSTPQEGTVRI